MLPSVTLRRNSNGSGAGDGPMLKDLLELGKGLLDLVQKSRQQDEKIKQLDEELTRLTDQVKHLAATVRDLSLQLQHDQELSAKDQQILRLQLETALLRFERRLPPASGPGESPGLPQE
jgi:hypothetical protein